MFVGISVVLFILLVCISKDLSETKAKLRDTELKLIAFGNVPEEYR